MEAYLDLYVADAMENLAEMLDYVVYGCRFDADTFWGMFLATGYADRFGHGEPKLVSGMSGTELAREVFWKAGLREEFEETESLYDRSPEYWAGWSLAYYQWKRGYTFREIAKGLPIKKVIHLYTPLHEASEEKFVEVADGYMCQISLDSRLKRLRIYQNLTQKALAERSGVNLRTLQQYESRAKDINRASAENVFLLAKALGCRMEDLLEAKGDSGILQNL